MLSSLTQLLISPRRRYGRSTGSTRSGAASNSICVPSSLLLLTMAPLNPALRSSATAAAGGRFSHASWL